MLLRNHFFLSNKNVKYQLVLLKIFRAKLRDAFDMVFLMDETCAPGADIIGAHGDVLAKVYSFMLMLFEKCVFVSANSLVGALMQVQ